MREVGRRTFLFHAVGGGLGHLSRLLGVADGLHELDPEVEIIFITETRDARLLEEYEFAYYQVPSYRALFSEERWARLPLDVTRAAWLRVVAAILEAHQPAVVVYDTFIWRPFQALVRQHGCRQVLIARQHGDWADYFRRYRGRLVDVELIVFPYHREEVGPLDGPWVPEGELLFSGPLLRRSRGDLQVEEVRAAYGLRGDEFTIVVTNGGGAAGPAAEDDFVPTVLSALRQIEAELPPFRVILVTGPLGRQPVPWVDFRRGRIIVREFEPRLFDLMAAANLVIARGGHNTVLELRELGAPAICIPAQRGEENQAGRIESVAESSKLIQLGNVSLASIQRAVRRAAQLPWSSFKERKEDDQIAANKEALGAVLFELMCDW